MFIVFTINLFKRVGEERWRNDFPSEMENYSQTTGTFICFQACFPSCVT